MKIIALTGAGGNVGRAVLKGLREAGYEVISCVRNPRGNPEERILDLQDINSCLHCFQNADVIVHMAYFTDPRREAFLPDGLSTNIAGMYNLYEAARLCGVRRVIFSSSLHVFGFYPADADVNDSAEYRPDSLYGLCKCWGELIGRYYSDRYGISCFNLRIGHCRGDREYDTSGTREYRQWISNRDLVQLITKCIEAHESFLYRCYPAVSDNEDLWSLKNVRDELGYTPEDNGKNLIRPDTRQNDNNWKGGHFTQY